VLYPHRRLFGPDTPTINATGTGASLELQAFGASTDINGFPFEVDLILGRLPRSRS